MKVTGAGGVSGPSGAGRAQGAASGASFSVPTAGAAQPAVGAAPSAGVTGVSSVDALLALQAEGGPLERKRRAVNRAGRILDVLDEVKLAMIDGQVTPNALDRLMRAVRQQREQTDEPGLEGVLNEIETRASVELAKLEQARVAA